MANPTESLPTTGTGAVPAFTLGDRLRKARESAHMEMKDLADLIDIHRQSVASYEQGKSMPKRHVLLSWSMVTGVDLRWIVEGVATDDQTEQETATTDSEFSGDSVSIFREFSRMWTRD